MRRTPPIPKLPLLVNTRGYKRLTLASGLTTSDVVSVTISGTVFSVQYAGNDEETIDIFISTHGYNISKSYAIYLRDNVTTLDFVNGGDLDITAVNASIGQNEIIGDNGVVYVTPNSIYTSGSEIVVKFRPVSNSIDSVRFTFNSERLAQESYSYFVDILSNNFNQMFFQEVEIPAIGDYLYGGKTKIQYFVDVVTSQVEDDGGEIVSESCLESLLTEFL